MFILIKMIVEYNIVPSAKRFRCVPVFGGISLIKITNSNGDKHDPWGTPADIVLNEEIWSSSQTEKDLLIRKFRIIFISYGGVLSFNILWNMPSCHTSSKVFSKSKSTVAAVSPLFVMFVK